MSIDYRRLKNWQFEPTRQAYSHKDVILYALGIGLGATPTDRDELRFLYERNLRVLPTYSTVVATPGFWQQDPGLGLTWQKCVLGEQELELIRAFPPSGDVVSQMSIEEVIDKGPNKGALILSRREIRDAVSHELLCILRTTTFARADGGFGGPSGPVRPVCAMPDRVPDRTCDLRTLPQAALLYRLNGDFNPLHADPDVAAAAGYAQPILHGLCTFGIAGRGLLRELCNYDPTKFKSMRARFTAPMSPGETVRTEIWVEGQGRMRFRCRSLESDRVVIDNGEATVVHS